MAVRPVGFGYADVKPLADRFVDALRAEMKDDLVGVALYGSVARGEARPDSDVDLLVVHRGSRTTAFDAAISTERALEEDGLTERLGEDGLPTRFSFAVFSDTRFADTPWLLLDISHHGIILFDPHEVVSRKLAALRARLKELGSQRIELPTGSGTGTSSRTWFPARSSTCEGGGRTLSNGEKARRLLTSAERYLEVMENALANGWWNMAVREAAEVVELCLKGVLSYLLVDYPKVHDVGAFFVGTLTARGIALSEQEAAEVRRASANLARSRAPAFHFETDETAENAAKAAQNAHFVHDLCLRVMADAGGDEADA